MTVITKEEGSRVLPFDEERLVQFIQSATSHYPHLKTEDYVDRILRTITGKEQYKADQITNSLILNGLDYIGVEDGQHPDWTFVVSDIYLRTLYKQAAKNRSYDPQNKYGGLYSLMKVLTSKGLYDPSLLKHYSKAEIIELEGAIDPDKDRLFTYIGIRTLAERYLTKDYDESIFELPQERFMIIAMKLMEEEAKETRLALVKEAYWALSNLYMTVATPTLSNAGKTTGQLSSCFIDTVDDSLQGIYDSNTDIANLSKAGGGIGVYVGKVRGRGSDIRGFKGVSSGQVPWIRQLNNTAVNVDQLGQRQGAIAVYNDIWHKDIRAFLDLKLNNGDERQRAHDIFLGACIPDLFMEQVEKRGDWYLFDPHEVKRVMGYSLEDYYDEEVGNGSFRQRYFECVDNQELKKERVSAIDIFKKIMKSQLETGTPFMFYRDTVNRANPNKEYHPDGTEKAAILCSNLCTEITQNQSPTTVTRQEVKDGEIIVYKKPGNFVVCNLSSINLGRAVRDDILERLIKVQVRMLDNVIDLNSIPVLQAQLTNQRYRAVGLGTFGWHHLLAQQKIRWESDEAVQYADKLYEKIAFLTIKASMELSTEKGAFPEFAGSEWESGEYFSRRNYLDGETNIPWDWLANQVGMNGIRNGFLMAVAPNGSTSIIAGSTASIDPIFRRQYSEEKKDYKIPVTAPELSVETFWFYKNAYEVDQHWSIKQNAARQRHIDQGISFNLYVKRDIKASVLLGLHMDAWKSGLKTTYYVRSTGVEIEDCDSCSS